MKQRYIVFLKQVPASTKIGIDPVTKTLKRSGGKARTNPDDLYALELAVSLKEKTGAEVVAVSMGPRTAVDVLREALQRGADRAVLLSSPVFAGSDTLCTARVLAAAVRKIGHYDMLFFGKMAIDGDTAQVGPEVAGNLGIPQVTSLLSVEECGPGYIKVWKKCGMSAQLLEVNGPCAVMAGSGCCALSMPTLAGWRKAGKAEIECMDEKDLGLTSEKVGLSASPTRVVSVSVPESARKVRWISDSLDMEKMFETIKL